MELYLKNVSAQSFNDAERFAREKAARWFGEDARCLDVKPASIGYYDLKKDRVTQSFTVAVKHKLDIPLYGFPVCRYCKQQFNREGAKVV